jgi:hypothetical protein
MRVRNPGERLLGLGFDLDAIGHGSQPEGLFDFRPRLGGFILGGPEGIEVEAVFDSLEQLQVLHGHQCKEDFAAPFDH